MVEAPNGPEHRGALFKKRLAARGGRCMACPEAFRIVTEIFKELDDAGK